MPHVSDLTTCILLGQEAAPEAPGGFASIFTNPFMPFLLIAVLFYFLMIRPERRKRAAVVAMLAGLKKNDRIVTIGGILGTVMNVQKDEVTIRVDESTNTKLRMQRNAIARVIPPEGDAVAKGES